MGFLDNLSKTLSSGTERVKFEADKFQRTNKLGGDITNLKTQIDTNLRQLGERVLELYQQGTITAPEVASLAQIIGQLRNQQSDKERELEEVQTMTFESQQAAAPSAPAQSVPVMAEPADTSTGGSSWVDADTQTQTPSTQASGAPDDAAPSMPVVTGVHAVGSTPYACKNCGYSLAEGTAFCPNCGTKVTT